jgi:hypothetical protein
MVVVCNVKNYLFLKLYWLNGGILPEGEEGDNETGIVPILH